MTLVLENHIKQTIVVKDMYEEVSSVTTTKEMHKVTYNRGFSLEICLEST